MAELLKELSERIKALGGDWSKYSVVGSFFLYLVGYLALRFHLTVFGIGTDLAVIDERYLFTGARFLVYIVTAVPVIVLFAIPAVIVFWTARKLLHKSICTSIGAFLTEPRRLAIFGIVFSVFVIQCVMVKCFAFHDLLLATQLPQEGGWLTDMLLDRGLVGMNIYFAALLAASAIPVSIVIYIRKIQTSGGPGAFSQGLLAFLAAVQLLMLPVNYGVLVVDLTLPRVAALGEKPLASGEEAWLAWEGKDGVTFLVRNQLQNRSLVTLARADVKSTEIIGSDRIIPKLFQSHQGDKR